MDQLSTLAPKMPCPICGKLFSRSNFSKHTKRCSKHIPQVEPVASDEEDHTEVVMDRETSSLPMDKACAIRFKAWLVSVDGGSREKSTAEVYGKAAMSVLGRVGGIDKLDKFRELGQEGGYVEFLMNSGLKPGTVKSILHGTKAFADFLECDEEFSVISKVADVMRTCASRWLATVSKFGKGRHEEFQFEEGKQIDLLINALPTLLDSELALRARDVLRLNKRDISVNEFQITRDLIIMQILLSHGHRTGVIMNSKVSEFESASMDETGMHTMFVANHKTSSTYGPAPIVMDEDVYVGLRTHLKQRVCLTGSTDILFAHHNGHVMTSNDVCRGLQQVTDCQLVTVTRLRKVVATKLLSKQLPMNIMEDITCVMGHRLSTQRSYYDYRNRVVKATSVHKVIRDAMSLPVQTLAMPDPTPETSQSLAPGTSDATLPELRVILHRLRPSTQTRAGHGRRAGYSPEEQACFAQLFQQYRGKSLLFAKVRQLLSTEQVGREMLRKYRTIQLRDKIRSMKN